MPPPDVHKPSSKIVVILTGMLLLFLGCINPVEAQTKKDSIKLKTNRKYPAEHPYLPNYDEYVRANLQYPERAKEDGITGEVIVKFTVEMDGRLTEFKIEKSLSPECDAEAIRVLQNMPPWRPGKGQDGLPERQDYSITVRFDPSK